MTETGPNVPMTARCPVCLQPIPEGMRLRRVFNYDEPRAILLQLTAQLEEPETMLPLHRAVEPGPDIAAPSTGVYKLLHEGTTVYVGKADNLLSRLTNHAHKLRGRKGIDFNLITCSFVLLPPPWDVKTSEDMIIRHYQHLHPGLWNGRGFGNKDPGRERDTQLPSWFDSTYPVMSDYPIVIPEGQYTVRRLLALVKQSVPILFRYHRLKDAVDSVAYRRVMDQKIDRISAYKGPVDSLLAMICSFYLQDWQLTVLPHGIILYQERRAYQWGWVAYPSDTWPDQSG